MDTTDFTNGGIKLNRRNTDLSYIFICESGQVISPTFAEYFRGFGYKNVLAMKCPRRVELEQDKLNKANPDHPDFGQKTLAQTILDADFVFIENNDLQIRINSILDPIFESLKRPPPDRALLWSYNDPHKVLNLSKRILNLAIDQPEQYTCKYDPKLVMFIDSVLQQKVFQFIEKNVRQGYSYSQDIKQSERILILLDLLGRYESSIGNMCQYIRDQMNQVKHSLEYYTKEYDDMLRSLPSDD